MCRLRIAGLAALSGLLVGAVVLGLGGRLLMHAVALALRGTGGFTWGGTLEVVAAGALFGLAGGLLLLAVPHRRAGMRAPLHVVVLFAFIALTSNAARSAVAGVTWPTKLPVLLAFIALLFAYSSVLIRLLGSPTHPRGDSAL